jgi:hypothetical protein
MMNVLCLITTPMPPLTEANTAHGNTFYSATFQNGTARQTLARDKTREYLAEFIVYVMNHARPCGECSRVFAEGPIIR